MTDKVTDGVNFSCAHLGPMSTWHNYRSDPPVTPVPARGKLFIKDLLGSTGLEMSINTLAPGRSMPFFHKHQNHDEVYFIIGGRGQFLIDGQCIDVSEGDAIRMTPAAVRAWRNHSDEPLPLYSVSSGQCNPGWNIRWCPC